MDKVEKQAVIGEYRAHEKDTGSTEIQVAVLTARITQLTQHLRVHNHDESTRRGLRRIVGRRRRLLQYLNGVDVRRYRSRFRTIPSCATLATRSPSRLKIRPLCRASYSRQQFPP